MRYMTASPQLPGHLRRERHPATYSSGESRSQECTSPDIIAYNAVGIELLQACIGRL